MGKSEILENSVPCCISRYQFSNFHNKLITLLPSIFFAPCPSPNNCKHLQNVFKWFCHIWHSSVQPLLLHIHFYSKSPYKSLVYQLCCSCHTHQYLIQLFIGSPTSSKCRETSLPWDLPLLSVHHKARICKYEVNALCILKFHMYFVWEGKESCSKNLQIS